VGVTGRGSSGELKGAIEGAAGWMAVLGTAAAVDVWALRGGHCTLSAAYGRACRRRGWRAVLLVADIALLAHLWHWPQAAAPVDPFGWAARRLSHGSVDR
jgi:hypothetical protein